MKRDRAHLLDIHKACRQISEFVEGISKYHFRTDAKTQSAVLHQLLILGEAVKRLSGDFRKSNSSINWSLIAGMRDKLIHQYDVVDLDIVWNTVANEIPKLAEEIKPLLPSQQ